MSQLTFRSLTCGNTAAPFAAENVTLKYWEIGQPNIVHFVDVGGLATSEKHSFDGQIGPFEFNPGAAVQLVGPDGAIGYFEIAAGVDLELTTDIAGRGARYTLAYAVTTVNRSAVMLPTGVYSNGIARTAREDCHLGSAAVSCPRARLTVELITPEGKPVEGGSVYLELQNTGPSGRRRLASGISDLNGYVRFESIDPGDYFILAAKHRHSPTEAIEAVEIAPAQEVRVRIELDPPDLYFALYYVNRKTDADRAFERAAKTWRDYVVAQPGFRKKIDEVTLLSFTTEAEFRDAWNSINRIASNIGGARVREGQVFSHGTPSGLQFNDGELTRAEIAGLVRLGWRRRDAELNLHACRAGADGQYSIAAAFAQAQGVKTSGFEEWGLFSSDPIVYRQIDGSSKDVYLKDYQKPQTKNCWWYRCDGRPNTAQVYYPPVED